MSGPPHNFVYMDGDRTASDAVRDAVAPRFSVVAGRRSHTVRRTWLDTFDWRLHRAGLTLEYITGRGPGELVLTSSAGERITATAGGTRWPAPAGVLPCGPLRDRLEALTSVRALLPTARAASSVAEFRLCNADDKTVAWLTVDDMLAAQPAAAELPTRLSVTAVRGYQAQTDRIARYIATEPGVTARRPASTGRGARHRGPHPRRIQRQDRGGADCGDARPRRAGGDPAATARHAGSERHRHDPGHRHRIPA